ncbi:MAG TPA: CocE/NonD family hydrolase [Acidimicrobiales bacterium]|nr:CocE/NonD family hydrolase [Acidimicrobiales bacterium]
MQTRTRRTWWVVAVAAVAVAVGLGIVLVATASPSTSTSATPGSPLRGGGSVDEAWLTGAGPGDSATLLHDGAPVHDAGNPGRTDQLGSLIVRDLTPGAGYSWHDTTTGARSRTFAVQAPGADPATDSALYTGQPMHEGLNYLTMRDGIRLAATVRYPYGSTCSATAPCPTVIEYSGYGTAGPTDPIPTLLAQATHTACTGCGDAHLLPDSATDVGAVLARVSGFATVSLQMRGTGCSGGAYDLFGYPSDYDAYDAIEIVAHQNWVAHHKVGMVGISYSGLSELPSAGTDPPGLAAIAPMSPTDDLFSTGYPGGIYNDGFAAGWIGERIDDAKPAAVLTGSTLAPLATTPVSKVGQPWTYYEIDAELAASGGKSSTCLANQALHGQSESLSTLVGAQLVAPRTGPGRSPALFDRRSMSQWATHIRVPVFVSGATQDEQTGPQWPALLTALHGDPHVYATLVNGGHIDSTDPQTLSRWLEFLDLYVADKVPTAPSPLGRLILDSFTSFAASTSAQAPLPPVRFTTAASASAARVQFAKQTPRVEVHFDNGAGPVGAGDPQSTYAAGFATWPPEGATTTYHLGAGGSLTTADATHPGSASLVLDPGVRPPTSLASGANAWAAAPPWNWTPVPAADGLAFQTAPFAADTTIVGPATLDLWVRSPAPVVDLQATVTEVRPAASQEEYVTSGFLRSSNQVDLPTSTRLSTAPNYLAADARNLSPTAYRLVRVPIDPIVHTFRAGTELRVVLSAPGGDRPSWEFATLDHGQTATVGFGSVADSTLVVDTVHGVTPTPTLPACGILRGEPCRTYQAEGNQA